MVNNSARGFFEFRCVDTFEIGCIDMVVEILLWYNCFEDIPRTPLGPT